MRRIKRVVDASCGMKSMRPQQQDVNMARSEGYVHEGNAAGGGLGGLKGGVDGNNDSGGPDSGGPEERFVQTAEPRLDQCQS